MGPTFVYNTGIAGEVKGIFNLSFGVFIDGTCNNKNNKIAHQNIKLIQKVKLS